MGRAGTSAPWARNYVTIDEDGVLSVFEGSLGGQPVRASERNNVFTQTDRLRTQDVFTQTG